MTKAYRSQNIFFALGVICTLTVYNGNRFYAMSRAKSRVKEIDRVHSSDDPAAAGYAAQEIKRIFTQEGVTEAVIKVGDTVINMGRTRRIGIRDPFSKADTDFAFIDVKKKSMVTIYEYKMRDTAFIRRSDLVSVTLIGNDTVQLSRLCCTVMDYSPCEALALLSGTDFEAILVTKDGQVHTTPGLSRERSNAA